MPNLAKLYSNATSTPVEESLSVGSIADSEINAQMKYDWLKSPITSMMITSISNAMDEHVKEAIQLAKSYPQHQNHNRIIQLLNQIDTLGNVIKTYGN